MLGRNNVEFSSSFFDRRSGYLRESEGIGFCRLLLKDKHLLLPSLLDVLDGVPEGGLSLGTLPDFVDKVGMRLVQELEEVEVIKCVGVRGLVLLVHCCQDGVPMSRLGIKIKELLPKIIAKICLQVQSITA